MQVTESRTQQEIDAFDRYYGPAGRMARYARARPTRFPRRQVLAGLGVVALWALLGPRIALAAGAVALLGEAVDCVYLRWLHRRYPDGDVPPRLENLSTLTAGVQAGTIAVWVALAWTAAADGSARFFAVAYLAAAALDAGLSMTQHPAATRARLAVYVGSAAGLFALDLVAARAVSDRFLFDVTAAAILAYILVACMKFAARAFRRSVAFERALLGEKLEVARANAELREREETARRLALVAEHATDSILITDVGGTVTWINDACERLLGYRSDEALGRHARELLVGPNADSATVAEFSAGIETHRPSRGELPALTKDGREIWIEVSVTPILAEGGVLRHYVAVARDVSRAKARERELADARIAAEEAAKAKSVFLATMSHEIRTPLNGIIGMADLLTAQDLAPEAREHADAILQSGEALLEIIGDVLEFSKIEAGRIELAAKPFDPADCITSAVRVLRPQADAKGLTLTLTGIDSVPAEVVGDAGRLRQVLLNLLGNAVKFTAEGSVAVHAWREADDMLCVAVTDTGPGIPDQHLEHIFESFAQADAEVTRSFGGTGLGLSISRMLARDMGGDIGARSALGAGACFTARFRLPATGTRHPAPAEHEPRHAAGDLRLAGVRVVAAEDNRTNRLLIEKFLNGTGAELHFAEDGRAALDCVASVAPDIVLMDVSMPVMDGLEATRAIRAREADDAVPCAIIGLTANAFEEDRDRCLEAGMTDFMSKPVRRDALLTLLGKLCPRRGWPQASVKAC